MYIQIQGALQDAMEDVKYCSCTSKSDIKYLQNCIHVLGLEKFRKDFSKSCSGFRFNKYLQVLVSTADYTLTLNQENFIKILQN